MLDQPVLSSDSRQIEAQSSVRLSLAIAFFGALIGLTFAIAFGNISGPESWVIFLLTAVTGGLLALVSIRPAMATSLVTGILTLYFVMHLNAGALIAFSASGEIVRTLPYITWFFPLVVFHHFTNFGFHKRVIGWVVTIAPVPIVLSILMNITDPVSMGAVSSFLLSYFAFVTFIGLFTKHRDFEIRRAALAEETERSAAALRVSEERFRLLSLATDDLVCDLDLQAGKVWWNEKLLDSYGYDPHAFETNPNARDDWIHPDDRDQVVSSFHSALDSGKNTWACEFRFLCADGRAVEVVERAMILHDDAGRPSRMISSTTDVSELHALEKKLRHSQKLEAIGQLTGGLAHDFNNLLTIIVGNTEELAEINAADSKARWLAETTMKAAERGATLTSRLLSFARLQALSPVNLDLVGLLAGLEGLIRRTITEDITITITAEPDVRQIKADPGQLENAVLNLVINARDAMPGGGTLAIIATNVTIAEDDARSRNGFDGGDYVAISVSDNGLGMAPETAERAFEPFFTTKEVGKGSGLGLSMVWGFVRQSNGHAEVASKLGSGTSVTLYFPAVDTAEVNDPETQTTQGRVGGKERILVVEDDDLVRENVIVQLGRLGYDIASAASASEALQILNASPPFDLLFTDVIMPGGMNGRQLAEAALQIQPDLKVLYTSGYSENTIIDQGRLSPGITLLGKPYRRTELAAAIRGILES